MRIDNTIETIIKNVLLKREINLLHHIKHLIDNGTISVELGELSIYRSAISDELDIGQIIKITNKEKERIEELEKKVNELTHKLESIKGALE